MYKLNLTNCFHLSQSYNGYVVLGLKGVLISELVLYMHVHVSVYMHVHVHVPLSGYMHVHVPVSGYSI